jgi:hypothetical protein
MLLYCVGFLGQDCKQTVDAFSDSDALNHGWYWTDAGWMCPDCAADYKLHRHTTGGAS